LIPLPQKSFFQIFGLRGSVKALIKQDPFLPPRLYALPTLFVISHVIAAKQNLLFLVRPHFVRRKTEKKLPLE